MRLLPFRYVSIEGVDFDGVCDNRDRSQPTGDAASRPSDLPPAAWRAGLP